MSGKLIDKHLLVLILLLAFALRIVAIDQIPVGLSHDEATNGVTAIQVLEGRRAVFFEINKGIEPLIIYLEAVAFRFFGLGPVQLRLVNIFAGLLTVALVYPLTTRLFNRQVALLAMAGLAIAFWPIFVSRLTLRAVTLPPLLMLTLYFLWRGLSQNAQLPTRTAQRVGQSRCLPRGLHSGHEASITNYQSTIQNLQWFILSGLAAGVTMYTYLSSRFVPFIIMVIFGYQLARRQIRSHHWLGIIAFFIVWAAIFAPLASYYLENRDSFTTRSSQVITIPYALNGEFGPLLNNTLRTLGMFTFYGDNTDRYNLAGRPVFDWVNGLLFYLGLGIVGLGLRQAPARAGPAALILIWGFCMLLPDFVTDDSPHFLRTIGAMPVIYIAWALGIDAARQRFSQWAKATTSRSAGQQVTDHPVRRSTHYASASPIFLILLLTALHTSYDYFGRWATAPEARYIYGADIAEIANYLKTAPAEGLTVISAEYYRDLDPFRFQLHFQGHSPFAIWFDGRQTLAFPPPGSGLVPRYFFAASAPPASVWLSFLQTSASESGSEYMLYHLPDETALEQAWNTAFPAENIVGTNINNDLILSGYQILGAAVSGGKFQVLLGWQALRRLPPATDYTFLVRLRDSQGHVWAEADGNGYAPGDWQPGVQALQLLTLRLPGDLPPRTYHLTVEVVDRHKGHSLPTPTGETVISLGPMTAQLATTPRLIDPTSLPNSAKIVPSGDPKPVDAPGVALRGYKVGNPIVHPGDTLSLILHWQVLGQPRQDYQIEFFLVNSNGDSPALVIYRWPTIEPIGGEWSTSQWPADYWVQDRMNLPIGPDVPAGQFELRGRWVAKVMDQPSQIFFELGNLIIEGGQ